MENRVISSQGLDYVRNAHQIRISEHPKIPNIYEEFFDIPNQA